MEEEGMKARRRRASRPYENKKIYLGTWASSRSQSETRGLFVLTNATWVVAELLMTFLTFLALEWLYKVQKVIV